MRARYHEMSPAWHCVVSNRNRKTSSPIFYQAYNNGLPPAATPRQKREVRQLRYSGITSDKEKISVTVTLRYEGITQVSLYFGRIQQKGPGSRIVPQEQERRCFAMNFSRASPG